MSEQLAHRTRVDKSDKEAIIKAQQVKRKRLSRDFEHVGSTEEGRRVLRHLMVICGAKKTCVGSQPQMGMDIMQGTLYNAARQGLYLEEIRPFMSPSLLKQVEFNPIEEIE